MEKADSGGHGFGRGHGLGLGFGHGLWIQGKYRHDVAVQPLWSLVPSLSRGRGKRLHAHAPKSPYTIRGLLDRILLVKLKSRPSTRKVSCHRLVMVSRRLKWGKSLKRWFLYPRKAVLLWKLAYHVLLVRVRACACSCYQALFSPPPREPAWGRG